MISLLFLLLLVAIGLTLANQHKTSFTAYGLVVVLSLFWFHHHATDTLAILL